MIITRKRSSFDSLPPLFLNNIILERVFTFEYLGVLISCDLSWSPHIQAICSKARKLTALIFRTFYRHASSVTLFKLYFSLVLPHLSYCSSVWDPPSNSCDSALLEKTQFFALKMCSHKWNVSCTTLLSLFGISSLSVCHSHSKLLFLFKILRHLIYFPPHIFIVKPPSHYPIHSYDFLTLIIPFSNTHAHANSFVLSTSSLWNSLPLHIKPSSSLHSFRTKLLNFSPNVI